jgi:hypothetical protein
MNIKETVRDMMIFSDQEYCYMTAADSCAGVGPMPGDSLRCGALTVGMSTARVPLLEVLAAGGVPVFASFTVGCGGIIADELIEGARSVLGDLPTLISTEKNMPVTQTSLGVTVTARCSAHGLFLSQAKSGDALYCAGRPLVGKEVLDASVLLEPRHIIALAADKRVHAIIPSGSHGVAFEAGIIAKESRLIPEIWDKTAVDVYKSAGPATCAVFAAAPRDANFGIDLPVFEIGVLR